MIALSAAALIGGSLTVAVLWPYGPLPALLGAPFGGSTLALLTGLLLACRTAHVQQEQEHSRAATREASTEAA